MEERRYKLEIQYEPLVLKWNAARGGHLSLSNDMPCTLICHQWPI